MRNVRFTLSWKLTLCSVLMMLLMWAAVGAVLVMSTAEEIIDGQTNEALHMSDTMSRTGAFLYYEEDFLGGTLDLWYEDFYRLEQYRLYPSMINGRYLQFSAVDHSGETVFQTHVTIDLQHAEGGDASTVFVKTLVLDGMSAQTLSDIQETLSQYEWSVHDQAYPEVSVVGQDSGRLFYVNTLTVGEHTWHNDYRAGTDKLTIPPCSDGADPYHDIDFSPGPSGLPLSGWAGEQVADILTHPVYHGAFITEYGDNKLMYYALQYPYTRRLGDNSILHFNTLLISTPLPTAIQEQAWTLLKLLALVPILGLLFAWVIHKMVVRPLQKTKVDFERVAKLDFRGLEGDIRRRDEIGDLNRDLRKTAAELQARWDDERALEQRRQDFVGAASHELKTPLALMRGYAEGLEQGIGDREEYLARMEQQIDRMDRLVLELLEQTRLERMERLPRVAQEDLTGLVSGLLDQMGPLFQGLTVQTELQEGCALSGDRVLLERAYGNLLSNAARYCTPGGSVRIRLERAPYAPLFTIWNSAALIPEEELPRLFEQFYRGDKARDRSGSGMGLAIARKIFALHHLAVSVENAEGGVQFTVQSEITT